MKNFYALPSCTSKAIDIATHHRLALRLDKRYRKRPQGGMACLLGFQARIICKIAIPAAANRRSADHSNWRRGRLRS